MDLHTGDVLDSNLNPMDPMNLTADSPDAVDYETDTFDAYPAMNKLVKCDSCGLTLNVPQKNNAPVRIIRCPNCSHQLRVEFGPQPEDSGETFYGGGESQQSPVPSFRQ